MSYLIDTCCISELVKPNPNSNVIHWFLEHKEINMFMSVISIGELRKGIEKLPLSRNTKDMESSGVELINPWIY